MSDLPWPNESQASQKHYRSDDDRDHLLAIFGTERPVAWITGSSTDRVGRAIARTFAVRGYRIVVHANRSIADGQELVERWTQAGIECMLVTGAIDEEATVIGWIDQIMNRFGRLDVLAHAAAVWEPMSLEETSCKLVVEQRVILANRDALAKVACLHWHA